MNGLRQQVVGYASRPEAEIALFAAAFAEILFVPVAADLLLIPMVLVNFDKAFRYAMIATAGSAAGGFVAYIVGAMAFGILGGPVIGHYQLGQEFAFLEKIFGDYNVLLVVASGLATIPFKVMALLSGFFTANLPSFVMASVVSRGAHYFLMAWLLWRGGARYQVWIERYFTGLSMVMALGLLLFFVMVLLLIQTS